MQRLRCIITADCQLLFNQMYVKRDTPLLSFLHAHKKEVELSLKVDLSYAAQWLTETKLSLQINGIQKPGLPFQSASSLDASCRLGHCLLYCATEVWCTRSSHANVRTFTLRCPFSPAFPLHDSGRQYLHSHESVVCAMHWILIPPLMVLKCLDSFIVTAETM